MRKVTVLTVSVSLFLLLAMLGALFVTSVAASPAIRKVPKLYPTIQAAIEAADPGDIIEVASGTYYEHVVVNKSLTLIGNGSSTIIDGNGTGMVVRIIDAADVEIRGFTVQNGGDYPNGSVFSGSCVRNIIRDNMIKNSGFGIELRGSNGCIVVGNAIMNNSWTGILIRDSSNNEIHYNMIANNSWGMWITSEFSLLNTFYHNNFIDNPIQTQSFAFTTRWDNGAEGNYWSDYAGVDANGDGIGDTGYPDPYSPLDKYPLIEPWSPYGVFSVTVDEVTYYVTTLSNSTLASFNFSRPLKKISFNATSGASGFCNVTIPMVLLSDSPWTVKVGNTPVTATIADNSTHTFLYFTYDQSTHLVEIIGTWAIPEFPTVIVLPLVMIATLVTVLLRKKIEARKDNFIASRQQQHCNELRKTCFPPFFTKLP